MDVAAYEGRVKAGGCFICAFVRGDPAFQHELVYDDDAHIAFLDRYPTVVGKVLVAPKAHIEHAVRDLAEPDYLRLMAFVRRVALGVEAAVGAERTYLLSLGSQSGNAHLHWHVAPLPPGVPYEEQQFHALMVEHGIIQLTPDERSELAERIRAAIV
jgi:histidine triad (HIT) family protein